MYVPDQVDVGENFRLELKVVANSFDHDGNLFAVSNRPSFPYYRFDQGFLDTQFLVVEISFSSVSNNPTGAHTESIEFKCLSKQPTFKQLIQCCAPTGKGIT